MRQRLLLKDMKYLAQINNKVNLIFISIVLLSFASIILLAHPVEAFSNISIEPINDAYVSSSQSNINFGASKNLNVQQGPNIISYLKFNLSEIPFNIEIIDAKLVLNLTGKSTESTSEIGLHLVRDNSWSELEISWNNAPSYESNYIEINNLIAFTPSLQSWNITDLVKQHLEDGVLSIALVSYSDTGLNTFGSKESLNSPKLEIIYEVSGAIGIDLIEIIPTAPTSEDQIRVYVKLNSSADRVNIYQNSSRNWEELEMTMIGNDTYLTIFPLQPSDISIGYSIIIRSAPNIEVETPISFIGINRPIYYQELKERNQDLLTEFNDLKKEYSILENSYSSLINNNADLQNEYNNLQVAYDNLGKLYKKLQAEYFTLEGNFNSLDFQINDLNQRFDELQNNLFTDNSEKEPSEQSFGQQINFYILIFTGILAVIALILIVQNLLRN